MAADLPTIKIEPDPGGATVAPAGFLGQEFRAYLAAAKAAGCRYDPERKVQTCRLDQIPDVVRCCQAKGLRPVIAPELAEPLRDLADEARAQVGAASDRMDSINEALRSRGLALYRFQVSGVRWLATREAALLGDDMGLGKTVQALAAMPHGAPAVVVCPSNAKYVWLKHVREWRPDLIPHVLSGRKGFRWPKPGEVCIINWDILPATEKQVSEAAEKGKPEPFNVPEPAPAGTVLVGDECHKAKSWKAARTQRWVELCRKVTAAGGRLMGLSGTPLLNRPQELWTILSGLDLAREAFGSWPRFVREFEGRKQRFGGYEWGRPSKLVPELLRRVMLRRRKVDVLKDLPAKTRSEVTVNGLDPKTRRELDELHESIVAQLAAAGIDFETAEAEVVRTAIAGGVGFTEMSRARACLATAKIPAALEMIEEYEESAEPVLVWSAHRAPIDILEGREGWATITGGTSAARRGEIEEAFQAGELRGVGLTIKAGCEALTLTRASHALFLDREWTPSLNTQAEDREWRNGQTNAVLVKLLVADHPLDCRLADLLAEKDALIQDSVDAASRGEEVDDAATEIAHALGAVAELPEEEAPTVRVNGPRGPEGPVEAWCASALLTLSAMDGDRAAYRNDVGFNATDSGFGNSLARQLLGRGLTPRQWAAGVRMCRKYHRQVGACPEEG